MLRAALALFVVAAVAWAGAMALGSAGADDAAPDGYRRGQVPAGSTGTLDCSELLTGVGGIRPGTTWVVSYVDKGQVALPVTLYSIESPEHFEGVS